MTKHPKGYKGPRPIIACWRCHVDKPRAEYPLGRSGTRISPVCMACVEERAYEHDRIFEERRATKLDPVTQRMIRRCMVCGEWKDLKRDYFKTKLPCPGSTLPKSMPCKVCATKRKRAWEARHHERHLATHRRAATRYRARHAAERKAAASARWAKIKADPVLHAQVLEDARINRRIRNARKGQASTKSPQPRISQPTGRSYLPSRPLVRVIEQRVDHARRLDRLRGVEGEGATTVAVCEALGVTDRNYRRWLSGEQPKVRVGLAESVLRHAGLDWHDVYPAEFADVFLAHEVAA